MVNDVVLSFFFFFRSFFETAVSTTSRPAGLADCGRPGTVHVPSHKPHGESIVESWQDAPPYVDKIEKSLSLNWGDCQKFFELIGHGTCKNTNASATVMVPTKDAHVDRLVITQLTKTVVCPAVCVYETVEV